jgi:hypothetical protein
MSPGCRFVPGCNRIRSPGLAGTRRRASASVFGNAALANALVMIGPGTLR